MNVSIVYYSMYGHIYRMAQAVKEGAGSVSDVAIRICRVPETLSEEVLEKMGALDAKKAQTHVPICKLDDLFSANAIIFGTPPYYVLKDAGAAITLASPKGGRPPLDPKSDLAENLTELTKRFRADTAAQMELADKKVS